MPNWCSTSYKIRGSKEELEKINKCVLAARKKSKSCESPWLAEILTEMRFSEEQMRSGNCRGYIVDYKYVKGKGIELECDTAWNEADGFRTLIEEKYNVSFLYMAEEPGMGVFVTNCKDMNGAYFIQSADKGEITYYRVKPNELPKTISEILGEEIKDIESAKSRIDSYNKGSKDKDDYININVYKYCNE